MKILITGSSGMLGTSIIKSLLDKGYTCVGVDIQNQTVNDENYIHIKNDCNTESKIEEILLIHNDIDILINNAGIGIFTPYFERTEDEFYEVVKVNLFLPLFFSKKFIQLSNSKNKKIINIASIYANISSDNRIYGDSKRNNSEIYSMSKAGIVSLTKYLACNFGKEVIVNSISPGGIFNNQLNEFVENYIYKTPMARMANHDDVISLILYLIENNTYINGQDIIVDGGFTSW